MQEQSANAPMHLSAKSASRTSAESSMSDNRAMHSVNACPADRLILLPSGWDRFTSPPSLTVKPHLADCKVFTDRMAKANQVRRTGRLQRAAPAHKASRVYGD